VQEFGSYCTDVSRCRSTKHLKKNISNLAGNLNFCHLVAKHERRNVIVQWTVRRLLYVYSVYRTLIHACNTNTGSNSNVKFNLWQATKTQTGNSCIVLFFNLGSRWGWYWWWWQWTTLNSTALLPGRRPDSLCTRVWECKCICIWCTDAQNQNLHFDMFSVRRGPQAVPSERNVTFGWRSVRFAECVKERSALLSLLYSGEYNGFSFD
jgi:hypothetical protein